MEGLLPKREWLGSFWPGFKAAVGDSVGNQAGDGPEHVCDLGVFRGFAKSGANQPLSKALFNLGKGGHLVWGEPAIRSNNALTDGSKGFQNVWSALSQESSV